MKRFWVILTLSARIAALLFLALVAMVFFWFLRGETRESAGPLTREKALHKTGLPLPSSAKNIQYVSYACFQDFESYVRFEAPPADCYTTAQVIFDQHMKANPKFVVPEFRPVSHPSPMRSARLKTAWFDTENIAKGSAAGERSSWQPQIWIDDERGIFYYKVVD